jgi:hypothetical protein
VAGRGHVQTGQNEHITGRQGTGHDTQPAVLTAGTRQLAGREQTAQRQITGFLLKGQLLAGFFIWLTSKKLRSVGDFFASTVLLHDLDEVLRLSSAASAPERTRRPSCACGRLPGRRLAPGLLPD